MSECFICQRTEGVVELPLGPFCVQCIKEIARASSGAQVKAVRRATSWADMWQHAAQRARAEDSQAGKTEWDNYFDSAAKTACKRASEQPKREALKKGRIQQDLSWAEFWSKRAYEASQRPVYALTQSEWNKKWENTARMIYSRQRARLPQREVECE